MSHNCHITPIVRIVTDEERATVERVSLAIAGMGCPNCAMRVRNGLVSLKGVIEAQVNHETHLARVEFNPTFVTLDDLVDTVSNASQGTRHNYFVFTAQMDTQQS